MLRTSQAILVGIIIALASPASAADLTPGATAQAAALTPASTTQASPPELAPIVISAAPQPTSLLTTPASVSVIQGHALEKNMGQSVMSAIQDEPGVSMVDEGPTVVKPVIDGLNSEDIVVAKDNVREDFIQWGNEHAPEVDSMFPETIEIVRGPNSLEYGSDALGGVIDLISPPLPSAAAGAGPLSGKIVTTVNSVNSEVGEGAEVAGASGIWGYRMNLDESQAGDFSNPQGVVPNTGEHEYSGDGSVGFTEDWGSMVFDYGHFYKNIELQNPDGPIAGPPYNPSPAITSPYDDLEYQVLVHDNSAIHTNVNTGIGKLELITSFDQSDRNEFDNPVAPPDGGSLENDPHLHWIQATEGQQVLLHLNPMGPFQGTVGVSGLDDHEQSMSVLPTDITKSEVELGEVPLGEAITQLTPPYYEYNAGEFIYEQVPLDKVTLSGGLRADETQYDITAAPNIGIDPDYQLYDPHPVAAQDLNYNSWSGALGGVYNITEPLSLAANISRGYRNPDPFELFGFGVHEGAGVFQEGNPDLVPETSFNMDTELRWSQSGFKFEVGAFQNYINNYIYGQYVPGANPIYTGVYSAYLAAHPGDTAGATAAAEAAPGSDLPIEEAEQANALLQGTDATVSYGFTPWLTMTGGYTLVRGENLDLQQWLPKIPADNYRIGAEVHEKSWGACENPYLSAEIRFTMDQDLTPPQLGVPTPNPNSPTPGYDVINLKAGTEFTVAGNSIWVDAGVENLTNTGYIDYDSILKEYNIENPGRNVYVKVSVPFGS